jgi:hypothetical protein
VERHRIADELGDLVDSFVKSENARREYEGKMGTFEDPLKKSEITAFRDSIFRDNPRLEKIVVR